MFLFLLHINDKYGIIRKIGDDNMLPKIVVMDLGDTIIDIKELDFYKGFKHIYDNYCNHDVSYDELLEDLIYMQKVAFPARNNDDMEISFINYLRYIGQIVGYERNDDLYKLEEEFIRVAFNAPLMTNVLELLELLKELNIDIYVLSNSTFSTNGLKSQLKDLGILHYFKDVYSSCDYLLRKPNKMYFNVVKKPLLKRYNNVSSLDIWYIGNDYHFDVCGSINSGLTSVWYNAKKESNTKNLRCIDVSSYLELCDYIRGNIND